MILVTGATGTIGRPLIDVLVDQGAEVRAVTRDPRAAGLPADVELVEGDPSRPDTVAPYLEGVTALFLHPRAVGIPAAGELLALARKRGVQRVVALSAMNVDDPLDQQPSRYNGDRNKEIEDAAAASGLGWVSLRASSFAIDSRVPRSAPVTSSATPTPASPRRTSTNGTWPGSSPARSAAMRWWPGGADGWS